MTSIQHEGKTYRLIGQEQGECLIKCGSTVLLWYKNGTRKFRYRYIAALPLRVERITTPVVELPKRYATLVAAEKRLPPSVERAFARGTMAFAVEVE